MNESLAAILHDHYNDTFGHIRERERERDRLFLIVLALLGFVLLQLRYTLLVQTAVTEVTFFGISIAPEKIPTGVLLSTSWTFLAALLARYYQVSIHVDKQYDYLHDIESRLCGALGEDNCIYRESSGYLTKKFRASRHAVWIFFTALFPLIVVAAVGHGMYLEWCMAKLPIAHKIFDSVLATSAVVSAVLFTVGCWADTVRGWFSK